MPIFDAFKQVIGVLQLIGKKATSKSTTGNSATATRTKETQAQPTFDQEDEEFLQVLAFLVPG